MDKEIDSRQSVSALRRLIRARAKSARTESDKLQVLEEAVSIERQFAVWELSLLPEQEQSTRLYLHKSIMNSAYRWDV